MRPGASISAKGTQASQDPTYIQGRNRSELLAHFGSGTTVQVELGRRRRYPGLAGPAPPTHGCYRKFVELALPFGHLLDVGCGAGVGLQWLMQSKSRVTGLDIEGRAVAFARAYVPEAELLHADVQSRRVTLPGEAVLVVDVLGLLSDPVSLLRSISRQAPNLEAIFVAEPIARGNQILIAPARRAFSLVALRSILTRSGFEVDDSVTVEADMLCVIGHPTREPATLALIQAERAYLSHQTQPFLDACQAALNSKSPQLCVEVALLQARLWFDLGQIDRSIAVLSDAVAWAPSDPRPLAGLSRLALRSGNRDQAIRLAESAVGADPTDFSAACSLALAYSGVHQNRSLNAWKTANALAPDDVSIARHLCAAALVDGRPNDGLLVMDRLAQYEVKVGGLDQDGGLPTVFAAATGISR
jgi:SAM-dependent methyltransferase